MSVISNIHTAQVHDPKASKPFDGQRLVVIRAKADKDGNYGAIQQTMSTSIPMLNDSHIVDALNDDTLQLKLLPHLVEYLHTVQNDVIKSKLLAGEKTVTSEELEIPALCEFLERESTGERWDSTRIATWFEFTLAENVGIALLEKGMDESEVITTLTKYSKMLSEKLGSKAQISRAHAREIRKALDLASPADKTTTIYKRFSDRVNKVLEEVNLNEVFGL